MKKFGLILLIFVMAAALTFGSQAVAADQFKWKMGSTWTPAINLYKGDQEMIKYVSEMTDGKFEIKFEDNDYTRSFDTWLREGRAS